MSSENEDLKSPDKGSEKIDVVLKKPKISYSREFLLSLSDLDICKKLPSGLDKSLLSELEDASLSIPERPRIPGSSSLQGFRRNEYGSSPPARGDFGNYSRGTYGKWESRSSGRSDRDSDSQSDRDSDSGRRYGHQSRRSWQTPEHDGLLGSGSFPRPSGYSSGIPAPKGRTNEQYQLSKTSEPYHPPRPYKAVPHSRRDSDAFNDETFGSSECTSEDRAEEERRRRASFEMIRKEQQKVLQEKQKLNLDKQKPGGVSDFSEMFEDSKEEKGHVIRNDGLEVSAAIPILSNNLEKSSSAAHSPASRPLVPPGFKNNSLDKSSSFKSPIHPSSSEVGKPVAGESIVDAEENLIQIASNDGLGKRLSQEITLADGQPAGKTQHTPLLNKADNEYLHVSLDGPIKKLGMEGQLLRGGGRFDSHGTLDDPEFAELSSEILEDKNIGAKSYSTSVLEKIFGRTLSVNDGSSSAVHHDSKPDDTWSLSSARSSKFAQWFSEEEAKPADDVLSAKPNDLLSLIVSGDKANGVSDQVSVNNKEEPVPPVLTCEDLEQSILSQYGEKTTNTQPLSENWSITGNTEQPNAHVDDHASMNLLSMLQKGTNQSNMTLNSEVDINMGDKLVSGEHDMTTLVKEPKGEENSKVLPNLGNTLTLETLFGSAFMKELQSVEAPVSVQRGAIGSARVDPETHGLPFPLKDNDISSPRINKSGLQRPNHDYSVSSNHRQHYTEVAPKHSLVEGVTEFQLPEEDNLISLGETRNNRMLPAIPTVNSVNNVNFPSNTPIDLMEKFAALGADVKDEWGIGGSEGLPFTRSSYEQMDPEIPYRNLQMHQSPPQFPHMTQVRPLHHQLGSHPAHMSPQMKFLGPEPIFNPGSPAGHQFSSSMIRPPFNHPNIRIAGFDAPTHPMLHQLQMSGNHPPHMLPDFPRGGPGPHHSNQASGLIQEINQMHGFPLGPRQPNIVSRGMPMPAALNINSGGNPPEAFQRLIEMELRANSKQIHPLAPGNRNVWS